MAGRNSNHFRGRGQSHAQHPRHQSGGGGAVADLSKLSFSSSQTATTTTTARAAAATSTSITTQQLLAKLRNSSISHPNQQIQLAIYVPPASVGAIIGRGGKTILNIQREAMKRSLGHPGFVRINVLGGNNASYFGSGNSGNNGGDALLFGDGSTGSDSATAGMYHNYDVNTTNDVDNGSNDDADSYDHWTPVVIRGDPVGAFAAVRLILPLLTADGNSNVGNKFSASNESCIHDGIVLDVPIHWSKHNLLVGQGGHTVAALSATYQTRIMIPPPPLPSDRNENKSASQQSQNQQYQQPRTNDGGGSGAIVSSSSPSNVIQLEGDNIDLVEQCLAKMISIVTGDEVWVPKGKRIAVDKKENKQKADTTSFPHTAVVEDDACDQMLATPNNQDTTNSRRGKEEDVIITTATAEAAATAEAVIIKIWTPSSKLLKVGKIRKIQRKTNTIIRRKKMRIAESVYAASAGTGGDGGNKVVNDDGNDKEDEELDDDDDDDDEDEEEEDAGGGNNHGLPSASASKIATKYIISGSFESVKSATAQFEKILGLEPGSSIIVNVASESNPKGSSLSSARTSASAAGDDGNGPVCYDIINNDTETENAKKRRKQKKGKKGFS